jgi:hypothetical protein
MPCARLPVVAMLALAFLAPGARCDDQDRKPLKKNSLMEKKLAAAQKLLGALALNDYPAIKEYAETLNDLSKQAAWKLLDTPRYETYSEEFQRITLKMAQQGKERNLDGAALSYVDMTLTCVKCHQHVREVKIGFAPPLQSRKAVPGE